jgi:hypothetical protein
MFFIFPLVAFFFLLRSLVVSKWFYIKTKKTKQKKEKMTVTKTNDADREKKIQNSMTCNK